MTWADGDADSNCDSTDTADCSGGDAAAIVAEARLSIPFQTIESVIVSPHRIRIHHARLSFKSRRIAAKLSKTRAVYFLLTVNRNVAVPVPALLVALRVTFEVPLVVGLPEIRPVAAFTISPDGKPVAPKLVGLLVAVI